MNLMKKSFKRFKSFKLKVLSLKILNDGTGNDVNQLTNQERVWNIVQSKQALHTAMNIQTNHIIFYKLATCKLCYSSSAAWAII